MDELWKSIRDFPGYMISNTGKVRSKERYVKHSRHGYMLKKARLLSLSLDSKGYPQVSLYNDGNSTQKLVHRLVAEAFIEKPSDDSIEETYHGYTVNHKDGNKQNNQTDNLEWLSMKDNNRHARSTGLIDTAKDNTINKSKRVRCIETGEIFPSATLASKHYNRHRNSVSEACRDSTKKVANYHWQYI